MRIVGWNVNGLRACINKMGFIPFLESSGADIVALQEVRAFPEQLPPEVTASTDWHVSFSPAKRPGYSGVAIFSRVAPTKIETSLGEERFDDEGRFIVAHFGRLAVASIYFPNGKGKERDNSRVGYKLDFYRAVFDRLNELRRRGRVYVLGDFNTAHHEIDLARPKGNRNASGFLSIEREMLTQVLSEGWVDTFRAAHPAEPDHYTWWRQFGGAREKNVGWRIDYVYASTSAMRRVKDAFIWPNVLGSDHCPVGVDLK
ncbi:MAG: exodeoxyribonuclease III [Gammaproteobacteria bacterium]|nr:exodeoxyribonuclease III [Gammaproteobacteria bacterium]MBP74161.1 exodeoxyribonuclease III [Gammaproteobacteria bacterium]HBX00146.1 exodeoxyribonuclease III [Gammaproteobacteria bacterium]